MIETQKEQERALLVGVELQQTDNFDMSMEELASLKLALWSRSLHSKRENTTARPLSDQETRRNCPDG